MRVMTIGSSIFGLRRCSKAITLSLAAMLLPISSPVSAQSGEPEESFEPDQYAFSPGGVNMANGRYRYENADLEAPGGLSLTRMTGPPVEVYPHPTAFNDNPMGQFTHNWNIRIRQFQDFEESAGYYDGRHLEIGDTRFLRPGGTWNPPQPCPHTPNLSIGQQLIKWSSCTIDISGTYNDRIKHYATSTELGRIEFDSGIHGYCKEDDKYCAATKMTRPDGTEYSFEYDVVLSRPRLRRVTSNRGFALVFLYGSSGSLAASPTQICLVNRSVHSLSGAYVCPSGVQKVSYSYSSNTHMSSFTDAANRIHQYTTTYNASSHQANRAGYSWTEKYFRPGESTPQLTNTIKRPRTYEITTSQSYADGRSINYTWNIGDFLNGPQTYSSYVAGGTYQESNSPVVTVEYERYFDYPNISYIVADGPTKIVDKLGREILADRCEIPVPNPYDPWVYCTPGGQLQSVTMPEGNRIEYEYLPARTTPITIRNIAKPGSGQANIVQTFGGYNCLIYFLCLQPEFEVDGNGNRTDYVYSTVHGGLVTKTGPADASGIRPQTRYNYVQRNARDVNGAALQPPVWVLSSEEFCKTTAASGSGCAGGASDEVVTTYDYGPSSGPNNLFLRGTVTTADGQSLRTCFTFDEYGRKISETQPKGTGSTCP